MGRQDKNSLIFNYSSYIDYSTQQLSQKVRFVSSTANEGVRLTSCKLFTFRHEVHQEQSEPFSTQQLVLRK